MPLGYSELALTSLMIEVLNAGMKVLDVGTHLGYEAMLASTLVGHAGKIVAFEPQGDIAAWARINLQKYPQARLVQAAAGESSGVADFEDLGIMRSAFSGMTGASAGGRPTRTYRATVTTLSAALRLDGRPVDFIKCDAEGAEMSILRGAIDILTQDKPFLVLEAEMPDAEPARPRVKEFNDLLAPLGYRCMSFDYDGCLKFRPFGSFRETHANAAFVHSSWADMLTNLGNE
jgi:FkbM family methyltransferase